MSRTDDPAATLAHGPQARCPNTDGGCPIAATREAIDWYSGAGEYCPGCGELLALIERPSALPRVAPPPAPERRPPLPPAPPPPDSGPALIAERLRSLHREPPREPHRPIWLVPVAVGTCAIAAGAALYAYAVRKPASEDAARPVAICAPAPIRQLAADLAGGYRTDAGSRQRFDVRAGTGCDVQFSLSRIPAGAVIAHDAIVAVVNPLNPVSRVSEPQLRAIFSGAIRDWAKLGGPPGSIVAAMPNDSSDESNAIRETLLVNAGIAPDVDRPPTSADVTRAVSGADRRSRNTIGIVAFSASIPAKVIPIANLPAPSVLSIATHRYPYTIPISVQAPGPATDPATAAFVDFILSPKGAAIVARNGLVPSNGS